MDASAPAPALDYRVIFNVANNAMAITDEEHGFIVDVNERWVRSTGIAREHALGRPLHAAAQWIDSNVRAACAEQRGEREDRPCNGTARLQTSDGVVLHHVSCHKLSKDGRTFILWELRDARTEQQAVEATRAAAAWHHALLQNTVDGICILDDRKRVIEVNERFAAMLGYTATEMVGMSPWDWDVVFNDSSIEEQFRDNSAMNVTIETRHRRKDGTTYDAEVSIQYSRIDGREIVVTVTRDISERKRTEALLRASEEKYRGIFDESVAAICLFDNDKRVLDVNQAGIDLLGYSREEFVGKHISEFDADPVAVLPAHEQLLDGQRLVDFTHHLRRKDGSIITVLNNSRPVSLQDRTAFGMLSTIIDITERERAEQRLADSEQRLRLATTAAKMGVWEYDFGKDKLFWSPEIFELFGANPREPSRKFIDTIEHPEDRGARDAAMQAAIATRQPYYAQYRVIVDGKEKWVEDRAILQFADDGSPVRAIGLAQDITARKQTVREIQETNRKLERERSFLRTLVQTIPDLVWLKDPEGVYLACNPAFERFFGAPEAEIVGKTDYDYLSIDKAEFFRAHDNNALAAGKPTVNEEWITYAVDGRRALLSTTKTPMFAPDGTLIGVLGISHDITEQRASEDELDRHRRALEQLVEERTAELRAAHKLVLDTQFAMDKVGIGISWADANTGRFLYANDYASQLLGHTPQEICSMSVMDIDPEMPVTAWPHLVRELQHRGFVRRESSMHSKSGALVSTEVSLYYHPGPTPSEARIIAFSTDITARKENERVLLQAKKAAEAATVAKSVFLANMSHEIRTPLNAITGMAYLLRRSGVTSEQRERLDKIERAGMHLLEIINAILDLSKIEAGKFVLEEGEVDLGAVCENVASMLGPQTRAKNLELVVEQRLSERKFLGDATRLQQGLLNYGANAVKFTERGRITLRVAVVEDERDSALVRFEVEDQGIGVEPAMIPRLFSAFEQADSSTTRKYGGTGLGLAITKKLSELMGGDAGVSSELGRGSVFWFTARLKKRAATQPAASTVANVSAESILARDYASARLLLVEDEPVNREVALMLLTDVWAQVDVAEDGARAVQKAAHTAYDLILMDMQMPRMDGIEATRLIRQSAKGATVPIVAMTANAFAEDRQRCFDAGMNDFLSKPVEPEVLFEVILRWLRK